MLIDTHCHIHETDYPLDATKVLERAKSAGISKIICVGTDEDSSKKALEFADKNDDTFATIGVHPHEVKDGINPVLDMVKGNQKPTKLVAIGEIGLDYFYNHSPRPTQIAALEAQIDLARRLELPISFHVREAFSDFWPIFDNFSGLTGVLHSFTDSKSTLDQALTRGLYIGVNGISTFTKDMIQREMFASIPLQKILLETDAPFLTPAPYRGKINEPVFVREVAQFHAASRGISTAEVSATTSANADALFKFGAS